MRNQILVGDVLERLRDLPSEAVHCVVTSPPYWGLRSYDGCFCVKEGRLEVYEDERGDRHTAGGAIAFHRKVADPNCPQCGGTGKDAALSTSQLGLEATPGEYIENMVAVFREVRRVLRRDGTLWLNMGDGYAATMTSDRRMFQPTRDTDRSGGVSTQREPQITGQRTANNGLKPKDLLGMPWRLAFALQADGWWLRSAITWCKGNAMPESVRDRPTKATEMVFLLTKSPRYFFDALALAKACSADAISEVKLAHGQQGLLDLQADSSADGVQSQEKRPESRRDLQGVREEAHLRMAENAIRQRVGAGDNQEIQRKRARDPEATGISEVASGEGSSSSLRSIAGRQSGNSAQAGAISPDGEPQGVSETVLRERQRESSHFAIPADDEGPRIVATGSSQETSADWGSERPDSTRVEGHQDALSESLRLLWQEPTASNTGSHNSTEPGREPHEGQHRPGLSELQFSQREESASYPNARDFWLINPEPFPQAHFATYPQELVRRCLVAGTSEWGCCADCGAPWVRVVEQGELVADAPGYKPRGNIRPNEYVNRLEQKNGQPAPNHHYETKTTGWQPSCKHNVERQPALVLDPFAGAMTTPLVALKAGRDFVAIELNPAYVAMGEKRIAPYRSRLL